MYLINPKFVSKLFLVGIFRIQRRGGGEEEGGGKRKYHQPIREISEPRGVGLLVHVLRVVAGTEIVLAVQRHSVVI